MSAFAVPPGPSGFETLKGMSTFRGSFRGLPDFLTNVAARHGPVAYWRIANQRFYLLDDPELLEAVFVTNARAFTKGRGSQRLTRLLGEGLLTSREPRHLRARRMVQPAFHRSHIDTYAAVMIAAADRASERWRDGEELAIDREMTRLALAITSESLFGADLGSEAEAISATITEVQQTFPAFMSAYGEILDRFPFLPITRRFHAARARLDELMYRLIARRRAEPVEGADLLSVLLAARDEDGNPMSDEQVRDEALTIFIAGHETTANALAWTWYLLARHPAAEARMHDEVDRTIAGERPAPQDWSRLPYTRDVFAEALRLFPPVWALGRRAVTTTRLGAWTIPKGSIVIASQYVTHRSPRWFADPRLFVPERWPALRERMPKFAYFPFGGGNRLCIGESFAWMEGVLALATIGRRWRFRLVDGAPVEVDPLITLRPRGGIRVYASRRSTSAR